MKGNICDFHFFEPPRMIENAEGLQNAKIPSFAEIIFCHSWKTKYAVEIKYTFLTLTLSLLPVSVCYDYVVAVDYLWRCALIGSRWQCTCTLSVSDCVSSLTVCIYCIRMRVLSVFDCWENSAPMHLGLVRVSSKCMQLAKPEISTTQI